MYSRIKRICDIVFSLFILLFSLPITVLVVVLLYFVNSGKPFFIQGRPGIHGKIFSLIKFKTMTDSKDGFGRLLPDSERLTKLGSFIRKTSIDELPQLINVIKGDMSLIGPRPLLQQYLSLYNEKQFRRHEVRPGITGWAQVNGRNTLSWDKKFEMDVWYVDNYSFFIDMKILFKTIKNVFLAKGINMKGHSTAEPFKGNSI